MGQPNQATTPILRVFAAEGAAAAEVEAAGAAADGAACGAEVMEEVCLELQPEIAMRQIIRMTAKNILAREVFPIFTYFSLYIIGVSSGL